MKGNEELTQRVSTLKSALHAILEEATNNGGAPKASLTRIQKLAAAALVDTFAAQLQLVPDTHRVVPVELSDAHIRAALGRNYTPEDAMLLRSDWVKILKAAQDDINGEKP